ncbi:hypothetical protein AVEN_117355-1 [Araneus ventricosus]|uniref:Uncharacterized protein n=1 Tax=Araneus ventricosus TaxID=182803 RepID=A0A4Y2W7E5_ARAVE|nr:hypothetical protein AVEN_113870-1 [Araneus ventricosus]GBO33325.1 hypothetical protein AVEN_117355-1 [Araneus ventricosus]
MPHLKKSVTFPEAYRKTFHNKTEKRVKRNGTERCIPAYPWCNQRPPKDKTFLRGSFFILSTLCYFQRAYPLLTKRSQNNNQIEKRNKKLASFRPESTKASISSCPPFSAVLNIVSPLLSRSVSD